MKLKYRLERCRLDGVKETSDRLTALGGQGWRVVSTAHHGAELFILMELALDKPEQEAKDLAEPKKGPGRPKKLETTATTSAGPVVAEVTVN